MRHYGIKRELNLDILVKFVEQHPELKEFVELVMQFDVWKKDSEKPTGTIKQILQLLVVQSTLL